jgi:hypothetical protein
MTDEEIDSAIDCHGDGHCICGSAVGENDDCEKCRMVRIIRQLRAERDEEKRAHADTTVRAMRLTAERDEVMRERDWLRESISHREAERDAAIERAEKAEAKIKREHEWAGFIMRGFMEAMGEDWSDWHEEDVREMHKALRAAIQRAEKAEGELPRPCRGTGGGTRSAFPSCRPGDYRRRKSPRPPGAGEGGA